MNDEDIEFMKSEEYLGNDDFVANEFFKEYEAHADKIEQAKEKNEEQLYQKFSSMLVVDFIPESIKVFWDILQNEELSTDEKKDKIKSKLGKMDEEDYLWIYWVWARTLEKL